MKKRFMLFTLTIIIAFGGGFVSGMFFSQHTEPPKTVEMPKQDETSKDKNGQKVLIGYVQDFRDPAVVHYEHLTHAIFSFAHPTKDGHVLLNEETGLTNLRTMVKLAHQHNTKAILAVGGWFHVQGGESYEYFKTAIANPVSRTTLVDELANIVMQENLDGIDIDFEHPRSAEDAEHLSAFTSELSETLHASDKELSIAIYSKIHSVTGMVVEDVVFDPAMFEHVDYVNIMAYDGQWDGGYNAANLSPYSFAENIVYYWTDFFEKQGLSTEKLVLGVPFYAQPADETAAQISYASIIDIDPANAEQDSAMVNGIMYHYNGKDTMQKKTKLALDNGFGGMMLWEVGHDAAGANSLTSAIADVIEEVNEDGLN